MGKQNSPAEGSVPSDFGFGTVELGGKKRTREKGFISLCCRKDGRCQPECRREKANWPPGKTRAQLYPSVIHQHVLPRAKASNLCCSSGALRFTPGLTSHLSASQELFVTVFNLIPLAVKVIACVSRAGSTVLLGRRSWHLPSQGHSLHVSKWFWPALLHPCLALLCPRAGTSRQHRSHPAAGGMHFLHPQGVFQQIWVARGLPRFKLEQTGEGLFHFS